jgi:ubiquinone/menaquinone biosynthesis C-methylase UbiE
MNSQKQQEIEIQHNYYARTAGRYDEMHVNKKDEHFFALAFMLAAIDYLEVRSILDIGSGTGRVVRYIKEKRPEMQIVGVEPVRELREVGYSHGLSENELIKGDATKLKFDDGQFDMVCEFGVLHHIKHSEKAVAEMLRVAKKAIFISDSNNFGQGRPFVRTAKQALNALGLWKFTDFIKTRGKGYTVSEGDGLAYSYSVFNNYKSIKAQCSSIHMFNTKDGGGNFYRTASHVALLGIKKNMRL